MSNPSEHLSWEELACKDGTPYPAEWHDRAVQLAEVFVDFRAALGGEPIMIASAYRTPEHNKRIGGVPHSQHVHGRALDCSPLTHLDLLEFITHAKAFCKADKRIGGLGLYRWGVHWDLRPHTRLVAWNKLSMKTVMRDA